MPNAATSQPAGAAGDLFAALAHSTPDAIVTADAAGLIGYVNPAAERLLGHPAAMLLGRPVASIMPERLRARHQAGFDRFIATGVSRLVGHTVEVVAQRADGSEVPIELSLGVAGEGDEIIVTAVIRDISERVKLSRYLAAQLAVTSVLAAAPAAGDTDTRIVAALAAELGWDVGALWLPQGGALRLAGYWEDDPDATVAFAEACRAAAYGPGEGIVGRVWQRAEPMWLEQTSAEIRFVRAEAALESGLQTGVALPLVTAGVVIGVLEVFTRACEPLDERLRDMLGTVASQIAESLRRRQHAGELARSNADLEHFAHMVAHDLSDPLRTINGFAELTLRRYGDAMDVKHRQYMELISTGAQRGAQMLDRLLKFASVDARALHLTEVDLAELLAEVLAGLSAAVLDRQAAISAAGLPVVRADRILLAQVLQNLIANALKFTTDRPPAISISAARDGDGWRIAVADDGPGIGEAERRHIFEMFRRAGGSDEAGLGMGLAMCAKIVQRHGGRIWCDSTPGTGSTFSFILPAGAD